VVRVFEAFFTATFLLTALTFRRAAERFCLRGSMGFETVSAAARLIRGAAAPNLWQPFDIALAAFSTTASAPAPAAAPRAAIKRLVRPFGRLARHARQSYKSIASDDVQDVQEAARKLGLQTHFGNATNTSETDAAFDGLRRQQAAH
jgi:hypothetical protein